MSTLVDLVDMIEKPEGVHNINSKLLLKGQNTDNQIGSTGKLLKQCFWNPLISMQKIGSKENKQNSNISLNGKTS